MRKLTFQSFLWQIILLTYTSYELVAHFDLSLAWSISGWFLNFKSLFSNSVPPLNLNKFSKNCINCITRCWSACKQGVVFLLFTLTSWWQNALMDISLHADTQHRAVDLSRYQFIQEIIDTSQFTIFEAIFRWDTWRRPSTAIHNPMRLMEQSNWLRYFWFCIRSSVRSDLLLVSHETRVQTMQ